MVEDNIRLILRLNHKEVAAGMHLVLLVALVVLSIMDQKVGMGVVVGGGIHLECEVEEMDVQKKEKDLGLKRL